MKRLLIPFLLIFIVQGCTTIRQTIYLQNIELNGPVKAPPLNITNNKQNEQVTFSAGVSINSTKKVQGKVGNHSKVNSSGFFQADTISINGQRAYKDAGTNNYEFSGNNLQWNQPDFSLFLNSDLKLSEFFAFSIGFNYALQNQTSLIGGNLGFGNYNEFSSGAYRIDIGINFQQVLFDAASVVFTEISQNGSSTSTVSFFNDVDKKTTINPYFSITYNSKFKDSPINFFISAGYFSQTIINYTPSSVNRNYYPFGISVITVDARGEATSGFINFTPGFYLSVMDNIRIDFGIRILKETQIESLSKSFLVMPFLQYDISL